jgi:ATP-binding cassette subfamily B protein
MSETIREFPLQLATIVGERGITLSGGQKQRATLARGLIRRAPVLAMDDCFSRVDTETEEEILSGLQNLRKGKTTLLISHRVSTVRHADRIFVIDEGRVVESGSHGELLRLGGYYADLEAVQSNQDQDRQRKVKLLHDLEDKQEAVVGGEG